MKIVINDTLEINQVSRFSEAMDEVFYEYVAFRCAYNANDFENIKKFFKENEINEIKLYKDFDSLAKILTKYKKLKNLIHHSTTVDDIEIQIGVA